MKTVNAKTTVILLAAGKSERAGRNKLWADVHGSPLWTLSYETLRNHPEIDQIFIVVAAGEEEKFRAYLEKTNEVNGEVEDRANSENNKKVQVVSGGNTRMDSFKAGLAAIKLVANKAKIVKEPTKDATKLTSSRSASAGLDGVASFGFGADDIILDHNAANPNVTDKEISQVILEAKRHGAAAISLPAVDTILLADGENYTKLLDRNNIRLMQTPQACRGDILKNADLKNETDLTSALMKTGIVKVVDGDWENQKITFAQDLNKLLGHAYVGEDSHKFSSTGVLKLGGVKISDLPALYANSDGDVILHAIGRALAQAHDNSFAELADRMCEGGELNSAKYLKPLLKGIEIYNVSIQIEALRPKVRNINLALKQSLSKILKISPNLVRISAMTGEGLTAFGRGEGIRCICILTCKKS